MTRTRDLRFRKPLLERLAMSWSSTRPLQDRYIAARAFQQISGNFRLFLVGVAGFEPATLSSRTRERGVRVEAKSLFRFKASVSTRTLRKYLIQPNMGHLPGLEPSTTGYCQGEAGRRRSASFDQRRRPETLRTAMAKAFFCPTNTTSRFPLVTPV